MDESVNDDGTPAVYSAEITQPNPNEAPADATPWYETLELPEGVELSDKTKEYADLGEYVKGMQNQASLIAAKGIIPPAEGADQAAQDEFFASVKPYLGDYVANEVPETYEIDALDALSEDRKEGVFNGFKNLKLDQDTATGVLELLGEQAALDKAEHEAAIAAMKETTSAELKGEWGDGFSDRMGAIDRVSSKFEGLQEVLQSAGIDGAKPVIQALDALARATAEDSMSVPSAESMSNAKGELDAHMAHVKANKIFDLPRNHPDRIAAIAKRNRLVDTAAGRK